MLSTTKTLENSERLPSQSTASHTPEQLATERLVGIDVLRGFAVLMVVTNHVPHYAHGGFRQNPWFFPALMMDFGYLGVPLFVLISGFCIHRRAAIKQLSTGKASVGWINFWKKRFWRLYPPYIAAIVLSLSCAFLISDGTHKSWVTLIPDLITHLCLVHNLTAEYAGSLGNAAFWSLGMEEQLYLLYIPLLFLLQRKSSRGALLVVAAISIGWRVSIMAPMMEKLTRISGLGSWGLWPFNFWLHWALGAVAVDAYFGNCRLPKWCSSLFVGIIAGMAGAMVNLLTIKFLASTQLGATWGLNWQSVGISRLSSVGELAFALAFFCLMNCVVQADNQVLFCNRFFRTIASLGKVSYSVYLVHLPTIYVLEKLVPLGYSVGDWLMRIVIYVSTVFMIGTVFYFLVEQWFLAGRCPVLCRSTKPVTSLGE
jgi:peptidoglycan/LPS O-acetylase OafA/YrhL